ncbi:type II CRISPR RNA-guided endonuclease Cas9 [Reichenbachiella ulvae]|uniref:CRISPR-associated endonuclease Cas9 n=1 Tax=Reichenbachiella ulvae TaxID=2980104 RepID=A0ABT3CRM6_9BACT|nr:type II CRISPR RNA-guided endonuclease Cas9 [Reichenbachiella ulvae]MCV9386366.1 type II CRISPR RNA-guided endonuclease Cas9 [Reichenbachiella ulvae]
MKRILGLDLGTNSIGWADILHDLENKDGHIEGLGSRIIPTDAKVLDRYKAGQALSKANAGQAFTAAGKRTDFRSIRKLYQRDNLRRDRLHRVLNVLGFLPQHYATSIDFVERKGQFKEGKETKLNYIQSENGKHQFLFMDSFQEMAQLFKAAGHHQNIPYDWTIYYLRKKALRNKITKEELAWLLLHFNQKRGYYQLRGEEEEETDGKVKTFEILEVGRVVDSGESIKKSGEKLYDIYFSNGWQYDKQTTKPDDWLGKTKEFIVTTSQTASGDTKRTFKAVDSEQDWIAIKKKTEQDIDGSGEHVGEYIFEQLLANPTQKIRGKLIRTIERKYYRQELEAIIQCQVNHHPELNLSNDDGKRLYAACIKELYPNNDAHAANLKEKGLLHLFVKDIIFYQRPLKSKKSTIGGCQYETKSYRIEEKNKATGAMETKEVSRPLSACPKSHPMFQEFRLWQFVHNLRIYKKEHIEEGKTVLDHSVTDQCFSTEDEWIALYDILNSRKEVEQKHIIQYLVTSKKIDKQNKDNYRWNYVEDKKYPANETRHMLLTRLKKVTEDPEAFLTVDRELTLWHMIYSVTDKIQFIKALKTFAVKNGLNDELMETAFGKTPPFDGDYAAYSLKAIKKLLPLMRRGSYWSIEDILPEAKERIDDIHARLTSIDYDAKKIDEWVADDEITSAVLRSFAKTKDRPMSGLNTYQACYAIYNRHAEAGETQTWRHPQDIDMFLHHFKQHSLRNPIVEQVVTETLRTVRDIWIQAARNSGAPYEEKANTLTGKVEKHYPLVFDELHVELGREMKNPAEKRKNMTRQITENENTNIRIREILTELMQDPNVDGDIRPYSPSHQDLLKIYEEGIYQNPDSKFDQLSQDDIDKIRKKNDPSKNDIQRYKLWLGQGYTSPYTGEMIPLSKLFTTAYQIEHVIPQKRYFDNSLSNKVICESEVNSLKSDKTGMEFILHHGGERIEIGQNRSVKVLKVEQYEKHCKQYFAKNRTKLNNLLSEDIPEGFINRQLNDSRYISKLVKGLLSNMVREENETEATSRRVVSTPGAITNQLKNDWGLHDKWNEIVAPRFERLNELTNTNEYGEWDSNINAFRATVPEEHARGFNKKRIDHRHHALDALVIACTSRQHIQYLNSLNNEKTRHELQPTLLIKNEKGHFTKTFQMPWKGFAPQAKDKLETTIISFKQNLRVINKASNKTWQWVERNGHKKKELVPQTIGDHWAIRKPMHDPMPYGKVNLWFDVLDIDKSLSKRHLIIDPEIRARVEDVFIQNDSSSGKTVKYLKSNPILDNLGLPVRKTHFKVSNNKYGKRQAIDYLADDKYKGVLKKIYKVADYSLQIDLVMHLNQDFTNPKNAFSPEGIEIFNENRKAKGLAPVYRIRIVESSSARFDLSKKSDKSHKKMEAAEGTNLFFAIYWDEESQSRSYETVPLHAVIAHQKQVAHLPKAERTPIPVNPEKGRLLFTLSPYDLVYVPTQEEIDSPHLVDFTQLDTNQSGRVYKMVSTTQGKLDCVVNFYAKEIIKNEMGSNNKNQNTMDGLTQIKEVCWKLTIDRLGNITHVTNHLGQIVQVGEY